jgi:hypothetical protein
MQSCRVQHTKFGTPRDATGDVGAFDWHEPLQPFLITNPGAELRIELRSVRGEEAKGDPSKGDPSKGDPSLHSGKATKKVPSSHRVGVVRGPELFLFFRLTMHKGTERTMVIAVLW